MNNAAVNMHVQLFVWSYVFISLGQISMSGIAQSYGRFMLNFLRNVQNISQSGYIKGLFYWPNFQVVGLSVIGGKLRDWHILESRGKKCFKEKGVNCVECS